MIIENLLNQPKERLRTYVASLSDSDKTTLFTEIEQKRKEAEDEYIRVETMKTKLKEDEANQMEKLKAMGINSYEELDAEINKLEDTINDEIVKYVEALKGE